MAAGLLVGEAIILSYSIFDVTPMALTIALSSFGSLLPDIDHPSSMLSTSNGATRSLSGSISAVTQHRGFTHTTIFTLLVAILFNYIVISKVPYDYFMVLALAAGMLSHLVLDTFNEKGVLWLWPLYRKHIHIARIRTGSKGESVFRTLLNLVATAGLIYILLLYFVGHFGIRI